MGTEGQRVYLRGVWVGGTQLNSQQGEITSRLRHFHLQIWWVGSLEMNVF